MVPSESNQPRLFLKKRFSSKTFALLSIFCVWKYHLSFIEANKVLKIRNENIRLRCIFNKYCYIQHSKPKKS